MDPRSILTTWRVEHRHRDGSRGEMVEYASITTRPSWTPNATGACAGSSSARRCDESVSISAREAPEGPFEH